MARLLEALRNNPQNVRFSEAKKIATHFFGRSRVAGSHHVWSMPWAGDPRINLQSKGGKVAPYQVKQLLAAIDRLGRE